MASLDVKFKKERETKSTFRFAEEAERDQHVIGTIYVKKDALEKIGNPDSIQLQIVPA